MGERAVCDAPTLGTATGMLSTRRVASTLADERPHEPLPKRTMTTPPGFAVEVDVREDSIVVRVKGELDMSTAPSLADALADAGPADATVVVDLSAVAFLDSSAIGTLVTAGRARNEAGGRLQIGGRSAIVERVFEITGLAQTSDAFEILPHPA